MDFSPNKILKNSKNNGTVKKYLDPKDLFGGIIPDIMFAIRSTYNKTTNATPKKLSFIRDSILNQIGVMRNT